MYLWRNERTFGLSPLSQALTDCHTSVTKIRDGASVRIRKKRTSDVKGGPYFRQIHLCQSLTVCTASTVFCTHRQSGVYLWMCACDTPYFARRDVIQSVLADVHTPAIRRHIYRHASKSYNWMFVLPFVQPSSSSTATSMSSWDEGMLSCDPWKSGANDIKLMSLSWLDSMLFTKVKTSYKITK